MCRTPVRTASPLLVLSLLSLAAVTPAAADVLESALGEPLFEVSHAVHVSVDDGVAVYRVRRVFANPGKKPDEARLEIDLPYGGAATGLRIRARDQWFDGELMEADKAAALYHELTGRGPWKPKDPALLYWRWADKLALQVFPVLPGSTSTVEYTLTVPTRYSGGRVFLSYPRLGKEAAPNLAVPVFDIKPGWGDATTMIKVDGVRSAIDAPIVLAPPTLPPWLEAIPHESDASYVSSIIEVADTAPARATFKTAKLTLDIEHTYKSDLRIALYPPGGDAIDVFDGSGGSTNVSQSARFPPGPGPVDGAAGVGASAPGENDVRGTFDVALPADTKVIGTWRLVVSDHAALDAGTLAGWSLQLGTGAAPVKAEATDTPVFIADAPENASDGGTAMIELAPPRIDELTARLGQVVASPAHAFGRLEVDTAPVLRALPKQAQVVFVLDASRSMTVPGLDAQLATVKAYLGHVPDAEVELVLYRRHATRLFGSFIPAIDVEARVIAARAAGKLTLGNGSALDDGAKVAAAALTGRKGPRRIVLITDELLRGRWTNAAALTALATAPADTVVHVLDASVRGGDEPGLVRDDTDPLAPIALGHHGIFANLDGPDRAGKDLTRLVLGLVRPVQIDGFLIKGFDLKDGAYDDTIPAVLREGAGLRLVVRARTAPSRVELTGMIWGDRFKRVVTTDAAFSKAAAAWVFAEDDHGELSPDEMMKVAMMGKAVSPVTSYVAFEPGTRPSTIGLIGRGGEEMGGGFGFGHGGAAGGGIGRVRPDPMALVATAAKKCVAIHTPVAGWQVVVALESTYDEVVDVVTETAAAPALTSCLVEAVWAVQLTSAYDEPRDTFTLTFR